MATGFAAWTNQFGVGLSLHKAYRFCRALQHQKAPGFEGVCSFFATARSCDTYPPFGLGNQAHQFRLAASTTEAISQFSHQVQAAAKLLS
ncbi:MAG TPA: hypothetical protein VMH30_10470 [Verrucomicrobiae bacterium]|jgi:hypothetical protein|nr:hypothetical protein [Verrucomicrobiae bacterium]